jgi:hypothetical protein
MRNKRLGKTEVIAAALEWGETSLGQRADMKDDSWVMLDVPSSDSAAAEVMILVHKQQQLVLGAIEQEETSLEDMLTILASLFAVEAVVESVVQNQEQGA